jgi:aminoglycoside phosphotransferase (APT) family kinase protein
MPPKMHVDEVSTDVGLVRRLLRAQAPEWAELALERVPSSGTDNALYRLGEDMVVRLPRVGWAVGGLERELEWLPRLAPLLPVRVPTPLRTGEPGDDFAWPWAVYDWIPGANPPLGEPDCPVALAHDLAAFIQALRGLDLVGPSCRRGRPLATQDEGTRTALARLEGTIDTQRARAAWESSLAAPEWSGAPVWVHGDLLPGNLLVADRRLAAVLDFALVGRGDPACDLIVAWSVLSGRARDVLRDELEVDEATWARGRGWALTLAAHALPYYRETNPGFAAVARRIFAELLGES